MFLVCCGGRQKRYSFTPSYSFCHQRASVYQVLSKEPKNASTENGLASSPPNVQKREMGGRRCRVVFSYAPQHDDELPLCVGQTITILQEVEEGWWKGVLDGQVGMFPSNFVEDVAVEEGAPPKSAESNLENINNQLNVNGDSKGQVKDFRDLPHRLPPALEPKAEKVTSKTDKTRINAADKERISSLEKDRITITIGDEKSKVEQPSKRDHLPTAVNDTPPQLPPPQLPPKPVRELARVMFPYAAEHEDELELKEGDVITVLCKELEDKGWWRGELNSHVGVFPDNFVELITVEETAKPPRPEKTAAVLAKKGSPSSSADSTPTGTLNKTDKEPPPPLPEKKVQPPPPPEKKPGVGPPAAIDAHDENPSLTLEMEGERLTHVTQNRPKGPPKRRPPSGLFKENEASKQSNGQVGVNELPRSPSVPSLVQAPTTKPSAPLLSPTNTKPPVVELRARAESTSRSDTSSKDVPWLQELRLNQRKKISGVFNADDVMTTSAPVVSPKPVTTPQKLEEKPSTKPLKPVLSTSDSAMSDTRVKAAEPHIPNPDYDKNPSPQPILSKSKPLPRTPLSGISIENRKPANGVESLSVSTNMETKKPTITADTKRLPTAPVDVKRHTTIIDSKKAAPIPDARKPSTTSEVKENKPISALQRDSKDSDNHLEEKVNAIYKDLLPKIKVLEDRLEENRKHQSHCIQMLMTELDEERKKRACMEVEIERLKKLVNPYAQV